LAIQSESDTIGDKERSFADREFQALKSEMDRISQATTFNGTPLLNGRAGVFEIQVGTGNNPLLDRIVYDGHNADVTLESLRMTGESVATKLGAQLTLTAVDDAISQVSKVRSDLGAMQNRLQSTINNLAVNEENMTSANSRIRDADMAQEVSEMTKNNILMQAGISVLGQANSAAQSVVKLLG
jgi:flagellin